MSTKITTSTDIPDQSLGKPLASDNTAPPKGTQVAKYGSDVREPKWNPQNVVSSGQTDSPKVHKQ